LALNSTAHLLQSRELCRPASTRP